MKMMNTNRILVWIIILAIAGFVVFKLYSGMVEPKFEKYLDLIASEDVDEATQAWIELYNLYYTSWDAYDMIMTKMHDSRPIHVQIALQESPVPGKAAEWKFMATGKPIFYKSEGVICNTVGEALMAIIYNEKKWKSDFDGDWTSWWYSNRQYYVRERQSE
jgi:hypothetical protein